MSEKTDLYRHFDRNGILLYVGISLSAVGRLSQHKGKSHWSSEIVNVTIEGFDSRSAALEAERAAIISEMPLHNKHHKAGRGMLPPIPSAFEFSSYEEDGEYGYVILRGKILDAEYDPVVVSIGRDGFASMRTSGLTYLEVDLDFTERLAEMIGSALDWYEQIEAQKPTIFETRRAYGSLRGIPPSLNTSFRRRCVMIGCNALSPHIDLV